MCLLDAGSVVGYLAGRGLVDPATASGQVLAGGVSNVVLAVADADRRVVVKQSLPRLRVADEWTAPVERVLTEADAMQAAARIAPSAVPAVLDRDPAQHTIVLEAAPPQWRDWKVQLLAGEIDPGVGGRLGEFLAAWHQATRDTGRLPASLRGGAEAFEALRVDPATAPATGCGGRTGAWIRHSGWTRWTVGAAGPRSCPWRTPRGQ